MLNPPSMQDNPPSIPNVPLRHFHFWCQKVLPLVYDDALSYYEVLCKVVYYINNLIDSDKEIIDEVEQLKSELEIVNNWIENFDTEYAEKIIEEHLATMIFVEINESGYITYFIPETWKGIIFKTTGYDTEISGYDFGHLVLNY